MGTFTYELRRTLKSKTIIVLTVAVIAISVFTALNSAINTPNPGNTVNSIAYGYGSNGSYNIIVQVQNGYGQAVQNSRVSVALGDSESISGNTDVMGYANFTISGVNSTVIGNQNNYPEWSLQYNYTNVHGSVISWALNMFNNYSNPYYFGADSTYKLPNGTVESSYHNVSRYYLSSVNVQNKPVADNLRVFYEGNAGKISPTVNLYVLPINGTKNANGYSVGYSSNQLTEQNMTLYATYSGFSQMVVNTQNLTGSDVNFYVFALFTPGGKLVGSDGITIYSPVTVNKVTNQFYDTQMSIMGLFIPLMAAVSAYATYGRDKTGGVLESVLVRPVSRKGLVVSRYLATLSAVFAATSIAFFISSFVYEYYLGNTATSTAFLAGLWSLLVISAAYIGLVYLVSNISKSSGVVLGAAIAMFMVFDFLWTFSGSGIIPAMIASVILHLPSGGLSYNQAFIDMYYISPAGLPNITSLIITRSSYYTIYVRSSQFAQLGITWLNVMIVGVLWIAVPLILSVVAFMKRG